MGILSFYTKETRVICCVSDSHLVEHWTTTSTNCTRTAHDLSRSSLPLSCLSWNFFTSNSICGVPLSPEIDCRVERRRLQNIRSAGSHHRLWFLGSDIPRFPLSTCVTVRIIVVGSRVLGLCCMIASLVANSIGASRHLLNIRY